RTREELAQIDERPLEDEHRPLKLGPRQLQCGRLQVCRQGHRLPGYIDKIGLTGEGRGRATSNIRGGCSRRAASSFGVDAAQDAVREAKQGKVLPPALGGA